MYNNDTDFLFPSRVIPALKDLRGEEWKILAEQSAAASQEDAGHLAFVLMMVRLNGCENCDADSYRAMRGCTSCAVQTMERYDGSDRDLLALHVEALRETSQYLAAAH